MALRGKLTELASTHVKNRSATGSTALFGCKIHFGSAEDWLLSLKRPGTNRKGLSGSSVRHAYTAMQQAFKFGVKWGYLSFNPFTEKRIELPRACSKRGKHAVEITPQEFFKLLRFLPFRERVAVAFAGWLGPRCSE